MPNWIEGTLKIRGKAKDVVRFFREGLDPDNRTIEEEAFEERNHFEFYWDLGDDTWVKDSQRAFVSRDAWVSFSDENEIVTAPIEIRQAWEFRTEDWERIADEFSLDIRLYGFERGMEFCQDFSIIGGEVKDERIRYDDWAWECPMPRLGG